MTTVRVHPAGASGRSGSVSSQMLHAKGSQDTHWDSGLTRLKACPQIPLSQGPCHSQGPSCHSVRQNPRQSLPMFSQPVS